MPRALDVREGTKFFRQRGILYGIEIIHQHDGVHGSEDQHRMRVFLYLAAKLLPPVFRRGIEGTAPILHPHQHVVEWRVGAEAAAEFDHLLERDALAIAGAVAEEVVNSAFEFL